MFPLRRLSSVVALGFGLTCAAGALTPAAAQPVVPTQFLSKLFTEVLGRVPDRAALDFATPFFETNGCNAATVRAQARSVILSQEYQSLGYDNAARLLTLFRGLPNREPDAARFEGLLSALDNGTPFTQVLDNNFLNDPEFLALVPRICGPVPDYGFNGAVPALALPVSGPGFVGSGEALQAVISDLVNTESGSSLALARKAVFVLRSPLSIPPGFTLFTAGAPGPARYALMARLVRGPGFPAGQPTVILAGAGITLGDVWIDGQRGAPGVAVDVANVDVQSLSTDGTTLVRSKISGSSGDVAVRLLGGLSGFACGQTIVTGNVITGYGGLRGAILDDCERGLVQSNQIVDVSSVGIQVGAGVGTSQTSRVQGNTIVAAGRSASVGVFVEPRTINARPFGGRPLSASFTGSSVNGNSILTSSRAAFSFGVLLGNRVFFGDEGSTGFEASATGNQLSGRFNVALGVSGMLRAVVQRNGGMIAPVQLTRSCPQAIVGVGPAAFSSGSIQPPTAVLLPDRCVVQ
jgi:hypothetical protein